MTHHLTAEARAKPVIPSLLLLTVLTRLCKYAGMFMIWALSGARPVLTALSCPSSRQLVKHPD